MKIDVTGRVGHTDQTHPASVRSLLAIHVVLTFKPGRMISNGWLYAPMVEMTRHASWPDLTPPRASAPTLLRATKLMT